MSIFSRAIDRRIAEYQKDLAAIHYREVDNMYREMRGWRHDFKGHVQTLKALAATDDIDAVKNYLAELEHDLERVDTVLKTGNRTVDAILNSKISVAKAKNVPVNAEASVPVELGFSDIDLCIILGNLFDNALEASEKLPENERMIRIYVAVKGSQLYISFTNITAVKKQTLTEGRLSSTKGRGHGFGLSRVDAIVKRLGGYLSRASEDGAFSTEILLPIPR